MTWKTADEAFALYIECLELRRRDSYRRRKLTSEYSHPSWGVDRKLARERAYDAETERLRVLSREARGVG